MYHSTRLDGMGWDCGFPDSGDDFSGTHITESFRLGTCLTWKYKVGNYLDLGRVGTWPGAGDLKGGSRYLESARLGVKRMYRVNITTSFTSARGRDEGAEQQSDTFYS